MAKLLITNIIALCILWGIITLFTGLAGSVIGGLLAALAMMTLTEIVNSYAP